MYSLKNQIIPTLKRSVNSKQSIPSIASQISTFKSISRPLTTNYISPKFFSTKSSPSSLLQPFTTSKRSYSVLTESPEAKIYKYEDVKKITQNPEAYPDSILIDVREPVEFSDGHIPGAINIPFKSSPGALDLNDDDFQENFGFSKPEEDKELVFYCLGGVRSTAAEELASTFGYKKRGNYLGSYEDWQSHENKSNL
ncbi:RDL2 [Candida jiufengensis]|uniref:RDL2 n=1 Tax=Candida jiufengensis TaxID=497108 RepID=UPI002224D5C6|nr:RDL2 [Candida jiufengensis]KAI5954444.1 RDL2 [Candida jiufengensis]